MHVQIVNLTGRGVAPREKDLGVAYHSHAEKVKELLTFNAAPSCEEIRHRAVSLAVLARSHVWDRNTQIKMALLEGPPFLLSALEQALESLGIMPAYLAGGDIVHPDTPNRNY